MIIGLTGLHGTGKTHITSVLREELGWRIINKRDLLKDWSGFQEESDFMVWCQNLYESLGADGVMREVIKRIISDKDQVVVIDAIHNLQEWDAVMQVCPISLLVGVFTPMSVRYPRNDIGEEVLDAKRIAFWHQAETGRCLMSAVEWAFTGLLDHDLLVAHCQALAAYVASVRC